MRGPTFRHALALLLGGAMLNISWPGSAAETKAVRPPALAGTWYPESPSILLATAHGLMRQAVPAARPSGKPVALLVPHAGWVYSGAAAASAFRLLSHGAFRRVVEGVAAEASVVRGGQDDDPAERAGRQKAKRRGRGGPRVDPSRVRDEKGHRLSGGAGGGDGLAHQTVRGREKDGRRFRVPGPG